MAGVAEAGVSAAGIVVCSIKHDTLVRNSSIGISQDVLEREEAIEAEKSKFNHGTFLFTYKRD